MRVVEICAVVDGCLLGRRAAKDFGAPGVAAGEECWLSTRLVISQVDYLQMAVEVDHADWTIRFDYTSE